MKKIFSVFGMMSMLFISSCQVDVIEDDMNGQQIEKVVIEGRDFVSSIDSRTTKDGTNFLWVGTDTLGIFPSQGGFQVAFPLDEMEGESAESATFTGGGWALISGDKYMAYYPFSYNNRKPSSIPVSFIAQSNAVEDENGDLKNDEYYWGHYDYMYAVGNAPSSSQVDFTFSHLVTLLELKVTMPEAEVLTSIEVVSSSNDTFVEEGYFDLTDEVPSIKSLRNSQTLTLDFLLNEEVEAGVENTYYICSAPVQLNGDLTVKVYTKDKSYSKKFSNLSINWAAGTYTPINVKDFTEIADLWNGETPEDDLQADNETGNFIIQTAQDLAVFAKMVNEGESFDNQTVKLANNIDLNSQEWTPIGFTGTPFKGTFDGGSFTISNFEVTQKHHLDKSTASQNNQAAFFGVVAGNAIIKNMTINNARIIYPSDAGDFYGAAVVGTCYGNHTLENINVTNSTIQGNNKVAGILAHDGSSSSLTIKNCHVLNCTIETKHNTDGGNVAGLVGVIQTSGAKIESSTVKDCTINAINSSDSGKRGNSQLVGSIIAKTTKENFQVTIEDCTVSGNDYNETGRNTYVSPYGDGTLVGGAREGNGYYVGVVYIDGTEYPIKPVQVGENSFATFAEAMEFIGEGSGAIKLVEDVSVEATININAKSEIKLDLNGCNLSYVVTNTGASAIINNKGTLNIENTGSDEAIISFVAENPDLQDIPSYATNTITNTGKLTIGENVKVTNVSEGGASYAVDVQGGEFILDGGSLIADRCALRIAKFNIDDVKFTMNSGIVEAKTPAWIHLPGSDKNVAPKITVLINEGIMQSTKDSNEENDVMYTYSFGNSHKNTSITIKGGEFLGGTVSIGSGYKGDAPTLTIEGGTFDYDVLQWLENDASEVLYKANNE